MEYCSSAALSSVPRMGRVSEGDDVLARWSDGLLYLGNIKRVSTFKRGARAGCKMCVWVSEWYSDLWKPSFLLFCCGDLSDFWPLLGRWSQAMLPGEI